MVVVTVGAVLSGLSAVTGEIRRRLPEPAGIVEPAWIETRKAEQLGTVELFKAFVDFSFDDRYKDSGIDWSNHSTDDTGKRYKASHYDHGNGIAVADVDGDGRLDVYLTTQAGSNRLLRNAGKGRFEKMPGSENLQLADVIGVTASFADIDNDGDSDLYATTVRGGNYLFENDGKGHFRDVTGPSGLQYSGHSSGAVFFDYDRDGLLDLFLCNVGSYTVDGVVTASTDPVNPDQGTDYHYWEARRDAFAGHLKPERTERSILYHNQGGGKFADVTTEIGLIDTSWSGAASPIDGNDDGWPDLYLLNMQGNDEYFENVGGEKFVRKSRDLFPRTPWGSMGAKVFDYDNDGALDLYISDMHSDMSEEVLPWDEDLKANMQYPESFLATGGNSVFGNAFYHKQGVDQYEEISDVIGAENYWPWGLSVGDLNADGYEDVFLASSMNYPFRFAVNSLLINNAGEEFLDAEYILGVEPRRDDVTAIPWFVLDCDGVDAEHKHCAEMSGIVEVWASVGSRSSVIFDIDDDGDLDILTNEFNSEPMVLVSDLAAKKKIHFLKVKLVGTESNRSGIGAVVEVEAAGQRYKKVNDGQSGYLTQSDLPLYFGLGSAKSVDTIVVTWPSGKKQTVKGPLDTNRLLEITEGS